MQDNIWYNESVIGTCGLCGGPVTIPTIWHGVNIPPATCKNCGATVKKDYGPILPMNPAPKNNNKWYYMCREYNRDDYSESFLSH